MPDNSSIYSSPLGALPQVNTLIVCVFLAETWFSEKIRFPSTWLWPGRLVGGVIRTGAAIQQLKSVEIPSRYGSLFFVYRITGVVGYSALFFPGYSAVSQGLFRVRPRSSDHFCAAVAMSVA